MKEKLMVNAKNHLDDENLDVKEVTVPAIPPEHRKREESAIIKETATLAIARYVAQFIFSIRGFLIALLLQPALYGIWSIYKVIIVSAEHFNLGAQEGMIREVPHNVGTGKSKDNPVIQQTALSWAVVTSLIAATVVFILSFFGKLISYGNELKLMGVLIIVGSVYYFFKAKLKSERKIINLAKYEVWHSVLNTAIGISLMLFLEIKGLIIGMSLSYIILTAYAIRKGHLSLKLGIDWKVLGKLLTSGFPIMAMIVSLFFMQYIDKIIVMIMLGSTMTGYYSLGSFLWQITSYIPIAISNVLFPRLMHKYGRTHRKSDIIEYFSLPMSILSGVLPLILGIMFLNIGWAVELILPDYLPAVNTIRVLILSLFFSAILRTPTDILIALNKQRTMMYLQFATLFVGGVLDVYAIRAGYGITGVASATAFTFFLLSLVSIIYTLKSLEFKPSQIMRKCLEVYLPFAYMLIGLMLLFAYYPPTHAGHAILGSFVYVVFCIPLVVYADSKTNLISKIRGTFK